MAYFMAIFSGVLLALSFSIFIWPLSLVAFLSTVLLFASMARKANFMVGFVGGMAYFSTALFWIVPTLRKYGGLPFSLALLALLGLSLYLSLYFGVFSLSLRFLSGGFLYLVPFLWVGLEVVRETAFTGFPWASLGYTVSSDLPFIQWASVGGVYLLGFFMMLLAVLFYRGKKGLALFLWIFLHLTGFLMVGPHYRGRFQVAVLQNSWDFSPPSTPERAQAVLRDYEKLGEEAVKEGAQLLVFPETTVPYIYLSEPSWRDYVVGLAEKWKTWIVFSATWREGEKFYNSVFSISPRGKIWRYSKSHLVPFGEYNPLPFLKRIIPRIAMEIGDFTPGDRTSLLRFRGYKFASPVCYEAVFPDLVRKMVLEGADFLVNVTNDAWYGRTSAPWQHFYQARLRAVENRRYLIRAASTGVSAVVDPSGRILTRSKIYETQKVVSYFSPEKNLSLYTLTGGYQRWFYLLLSLVMLILVLAKALVGRGKFFII